ncbi:venom serine protease isoform X1 [Drosophila busckii]|uniref:venom serine protease isoform X1 n=1 Tax=Drosophila busckii TaxID=30019 RepID=UPI00083F006C|nr:venom serine protease isoform X1 [Drosophila busckii]
MLLFSKVLLLLLLFSQSIAQQCSWQYSLRSNQPLNVTSQNFPRALPAGSNCRYQLRAPANHIIQLTCLFEVYPDTCQAKYLHISRDGDLQFRDGERFCRYGRISASSNFQTMALMYQSNSAATQQRARLNCQAVARPVACNCGWSSPPRIANGVEAAKHEFPSMVGLRDLSSNLPIICGGSIISDRYIVTAAHCTVRQPVASRWIALVGDHELSSASESAFETQHSIQSIINHPDYNSNSHANDIALLRTVRSIEWSRGVAPICLPFGRNTLSETFEAVDIAGWGTLGFGAAKSNTLQKASLMTIANAQCSANYNVSIAASQICTFDHLGAGRDSCQFDSGGPLIHRQQGRLYLLGVISYGRACGQRYGVGINTRISAYLNWLWNYVNGAVCVR